MEPRDLLFYPLGLGYFCCWWESSHCVDHVSSGRWGWVWSHTRSSSLWPWCPFVPSVQMCSVTQGCPTLCDPMDCSTPDSPVPHHLPEFAHTHVQMEEGRKIWACSSLATPAPPPGEGQSRWLGIWVKDLVETKWARTSLVVQWLRLGLPLQGVRVWSLLRELRFHLSQGQKTKT